MKLKKHIATLFDEGDPIEWTQLCSLQITLSDVFEIDPEAEVRIHIKGQVYFIQITDMEENETK